MLKEAQSLTSGGGFAPKGLYDDATSPDFKVRVSACVHAGTIPYAGR